MWPLSKCCHKAVPLALLIGMATGGAVYAQSNIAPGVDDALNSSEEVRLLVVMTPPSSYEEASFAFRSPTRFIRNILGESKGDVRRVGKYAIVAANMNRNDVALLRGNPRVKTVALNRLRILRLDRSIPELNVGALAENSDHGESFAVAVLDTGVNYQHEFLKGRLQGEACYSTTLDIPGRKAESLCPYGHRRNTRAC